MSTLCEISYRDNAATITLRADKETHPPTLDHSTLVQLEERLREIELRADDLKLVFLRSASARYFCVGANVNALRELSASTVGDWVEHGHRVFSRLEDLPLPTVARVEGYALGGGLELAMACDLIFATEAAQFGQPETRLGFVAGWGASWRLPRRVGPSRAKWLFYSGRSIAALAAGQMGLADVVVPPEKIEGVCAEFLADVHLGSSRSASEHKRLVASHAIFSRADSLREEAAASRQCLAAPDTQARLGAFLNRKKK